MSFLRALVTSLACFLRGRRGVDELDDEAFYRTYYGSTTIPKDIPIRLRKIIVKQLGGRWKTLKPQDQLIDNDEIDFAELLYDIEEEFDISMPEYDKQELAASFDAIVQYIARARQA